MQADGHLKITQEALRLVNQQCPDFVTFCEILKQNHDYDGALPGISNVKMRSVVEVARWAKLFLFSEPDSLANQVMGIDFPPFFWTHGAPGGQRYHFMRSNEEESEQHAHRSGCEHIKHCLNLWVCGMNKIYKATGEMSQNIWHPSIASTLLPVIRS